MADTWRVVPLSSTTAYLQHNEVAWARSVFMSYDEAVALAAETNEKLRRERLEREGSTDAET